VLRELIQQIEMEKSASYDEAVFSAFLDELSLIKEAGFKDKILKPVARFFRAQPKPSQPIAPQFSGHTATMNRAMGPRVGGHGEVTQKFMDPRTGKYHERSYLEIPGLT
jgi:hypothetical protein